MGYRTVDAADVELGPGPHPAASPYDRRISEQLGLRAFEVYQVELPPGAATVAHDHLDDRVEDMYAVVSGSGWVVVDDERIPVAPGRFTAVTQDSRRYVQAGEDGLVLIAVCAG